MNYKNGIQYLVNAILSGGTIDGATIGATTPGLVYLKKGADFTGATVDLSTATGNVLDITTDTTALATFGTVNAGAIFILRFTSVRTLTYNAVSMILPGARSIDTDVGDRAIFESLGSGNWLCHDYLKASGIAVGNTDEQIIAATANMTRRQAFGGLINNYNQANDTVITLPAIEKGMNFTVILGTTVAKYFRLDPNASDTIYLDGVADSDGHYCGVVSAAAGNAIQFVAFQTGASTYDWFATTISGAWIME